MAESNLPLVIDGITKQIATATRLQHVYPFLPPAPGSDAMFYFTLRRWRRLPGALQEMSIEWEFDGWAVVPYLNSETAEKQRATLIVQILGVSGKNLSLGGALADGQVLIEAGECDVGSIQGVKVLAAQFVIRATENIEYSEWALGM